MMKGGVSTMQQTIKASLNMAANNHTVLSFGFKSGDRSLDLDEENNGVQIKEVFAHLLEEMHDGAVQIELDIPEARANDLYGIVSKAYIAQLNAEIQRVQPKVDALKQKCSKTTI